MLLESLLKRWPKTEIEYMQAYVVVMPIFDEGKNQDLFKADHWEEIKETWDTIIADLGRKFGVWHSDKSRFKDWLMLQRFRHAEQKYKELLCSSCPFSSGVEAFRPNAAYIPCTLTDEDIFNFGNRLRNCGCIGSGFSRRSIKKKIKEVPDEQVQKEFFKRAKELGGMRGIRPKVDYLF